MVDKILTILNMKTITDLYINFGNLVSKSDQDGFDGQIFCQLPTNLYFILSITACKSVQILNIVAML